MGENNFFDDLKIRTPIIPFDDLGVAGTYKHDLSLPNDAFPTISHMTALGPDKAKSLRSDKAGRLLVSSGGPGTVKSVSNSGFPVSGGSVLAHVDGISAIVAASIAITPFDSTAAPHGGIIGQLAYYPDDGSDLIDIINTTGGTTIYKDPSTGNYLIGGGGQNAMSYANPIDLTDVNGKPSGGEFNFGITAGSVSVWAIFTVMYT